MTEKALVKNASDEKQVIDATGKEKRGRELELNDIRQVLSSVQGRRLIWRLLSKCQTFSTVWEPSAKIHYNSGQQDMGHFIMAEIVDANENLLFTMMKENMKGKENNV